MAFDRTRFNIRTHCLREKSSAPANKRMNVIWHDEIAPETNSPQFSKLAKRMSALCTLEFARSFRRSCVLKVTNTSVDRIAEKPDTIVAVY